MKKQVFAIAALSSAAAFAAPSIPCASIPLAQDSSSGLVTIDYTLEIEAAVVTADILTNGVSVGEAVLGSLAGDVNRKVGAGANRKILWRPDRSWSEDVEIAAGGVTVQLKAWSLATPPDYLVADLTVSNSIHFYTSTNALPGGLEDERYRTTHLVMRRIAAKDVEYRMGWEYYNATFPSAANVTGCAPHYVKMTNDYYVAVYETTQAQYQNAVGSNPSANGTLDAWPSAQHPVENVSLSDLRGTSPRWPQGGHAVAASTPIDKFRSVTGLAFDLPTEAQWEFACRAGEKQAYANGCKEDWGNRKNIGWLQGNGEGYAQGKAHFRVGLKQPNAWGLYDMHGNVLEWCLDRGDKTWNSASDNWYMNAYVANSGDDPCVEPAGASTGDVGTLRGGSAQHSDGVSYAYARYQSGINFSTTKWNSLGFRLVCPGIIP